MVSEGFSVTFLTFSKIFMTHKRLSVFGLKALYAFLLGQEVYQYKPLHFSVPIYEIVVSAPWISDDIADLLIS